MNPKKISALSEKIRAEAALLGADLLLSKFVFSALIRDFQVKCNAETALIIASHF